MNQYPSLDSLNLNTLELIKNEYPSSEKQNLISPESFDPYMNRSTDELSTKRSNYRDELSTKRTINTNQNDSLVKIIVEDVKDYHEKQSNKQNNFESKNKLYENQVLNN